MNQRYLNKNTQRGVVLFVALIALVVMSLAAVSLIRNVDTNTKIAGNLAFKQASLVAADRGIEAAYDWLDDEQVKDSTLADLNSHKASDGYHATYLNLKLDDISNLRDDAIWTNNSKAVADGGDGNTIDYIIERMCVLEGPPAQRTTNQCTFGESTSTGQGAGGIDAQQVVNDLGALSPVYRVTARITDIKNNRTYVQAYAF